MTEYWKSNERHWCSLCMVWCDNKKSSIRTHELGERHRAAVEKRLYTAQKGENKEEKEKGKEKEALEEIERLARARYQEDLASGIASTPLTTPPPSTVSSTLYSQSVYGTDSSTKAAAQELAEKLNKAASAKEAVAIAATAASKGKATDASSSSSSTVDNKLPSNSWTIVNRATESNNNNKNSNNSSSANRPPASALPAGWSSNTMERDKQKKRKRNVDGIDLDGQEDEAEAASILEASPLSALLSSGLVADNDNSSSTTGSSGSQSNTPNAMKVELTLPKVSLTNNSTNNNESGNVSNTQSIAISSNTTAAAAPSSSSGASSGGGLFKKKFGIKK